MNSQEAKLDAQSKEKQMGVMGQRLVQNLNEQVRTATPMPVVAGVDAGAVNGVVKRRVEDETFLGNTKGLRLKNETLQQFCGRTELSLDEIRTQPRKELERLIKIRAANRKEEGVFAPVNTIRLPPAPGQLPANMVDTETIEPGLQYETSVPESI